jgi:T4-like virus tail tube protein gp19
MSRSQISDYLQTGRFHVLDISLSLPPILLPVFSFKSCSLPAMEADIASHKEANYEFPRKYIIGGSVGTMTLEQGVSLFNSDFYDWITKAIDGTASPKNLMVIQFSRISVDAAIEGVGGAQNATQGFTNKLNFFTDATGPLHIPGRAWIMKQCRPKSYLPGQTLDGSSMDVSIASLEIDLEEYEEISFGV